MGGRQLRNLDTPLIISRQAEKKPGYECTALLVYIIFEKHFLRIILYNNDGKSQGV